MYKVLLCRVFGQTPQVIVTDSGFVPNLAKDAEGLPEEIKLAFCEWNLG